MCTGSGCSHFSPSFFFPFSSPYQVSRKPKQQLQQQEPQIFTRIEIPALYPLHFFSFSLLSPYMKRIATFCDKNSLSSLPPQHLLYHIFLWVWEEGCVQRFRLQSFFSFPPFPLPSPIKSAGNQSDNCNNRNFKSSQE